MGAEDDHRAWSSYGGRWRVVRVSYPRPRLVWGRPPVVAFLIGLAMAGAGYLLLRPMLSLRGWTDGHPSGDEAGYWVRLVATVLAVVAVAVLGWGGWTALRALVDLGSRREVEGQVVRLRSWRRAENEHDYFAAVDDGRSDRIRVWLVPAATYARLWEGVTASATVGPRLGYVFRMDLVGQPAAARPAPGPEPVEAATPRAGTDAGETVRLLARVHGRFGEAVPGVGDRAWLRGDTVAVVRGDVMVSIRLQGRHVPDRPAAATETPA
jgi:hypothetical protein